ncbi:DUF6443 domain-containing protein [Chitinophaga defluvii]|uniref:DUF6443 domain-containing protein n=1 Tax=Chitinophaga defluvii TaxID=3163343 RepID=A0ABV2TAZ8_9BACT
MKKFLNALLFATFLINIPLMVWSQNYPVNTTPGTPTVLPVPGSYPAVIKGSYQRVYNLRKGVTDASTITTATPIENATVVTKYQDGSNREFQVVAKQISPLKKDLVTMTLYDQFNRESIKYLPYVASTGNFNDGKLKQNPFANTIQFNSGINSGEQIFYGKVEFDGSPLNSVRKVAAPGNSWAGAGRAVNYFERANVLSDSVRRWSIGFSIDDIPINEGIYAAGELFVKEEVDEDGGRSVNYIDIQGRTVLSRKQQAASATSGHMGWSNTYFVYDELNRLRVVIPPLAVESIISDWKLNTGNIMKNLCYRYSYDERKRVIREEEPGIGAVEKVYDGVDRVVFHRDGNLRTQGKWIVNFYDGLNRKVMTALYPTAATREQLQLSMNNAVAANTKITQTIPGIKELLIANRETGKASYRAGESISFNPGFESETNADFLAEIDPNFNLGTEEIIITNVLPGITGYEPLVYTYYDDYTFAGAKGFDNSYTAKLQAANNVNGDPLAASLLTKGLVTGTRTRVLGSDQWLTATLKYDTKGRNVQTLTDNLTGGEDIATNLYDFNNQLLGSYQHHKNPGSAVSASLRMQAIYFYDHAGRVKTVKKRLNDNASLDRTIVQQEYAELGNPKLEKIGVKTDGTSLEELSYDYNIRGWLKSINKDYVAQANNTTNKFGLDLSYDAGFNIPRYNGVPAGVKWKGANDKTARAYGFIYDKLNQLSIADFSQQNTGSTNWTKDRADFTVSNLKYDGNGNILSMTQRGLKGGVTQIVDSLKYGYTPQSNLLSYVTDKKNDAQSTLGDFKEVVNNETQDYWYDANGNLTKDLNKNIAEITYNYLNQPEQITVTGKGTIRYFYDAEGYKLKKVVQENGQPERVYHYLNGVVYLNDSLQFAVHEKGRIRAIYKAGEPIDYAYDYFIQDHQQNTRMVLTDQVDFSMYAATMEQERSATENALFSNITETRIAKPAGYPQSTSGTNAYVAKLNAENSGKKIGPSLVLKVMAGDSVQIGVSAFFKSNGPQEKKTLAPVEDMIEALARTFNANPEVGDLHNVSQEALQGPFDNNFYNNQYQRLKEREPSQYNSNKPKAYLNYVLFDEQFNLVEENSGVKQVQGEPDQLQTLAKDKMKIASSGFLYVYTSNETQQDMFFDNLVVEHVSGPILEETHYYPYGVALSGISYDAPGKLQNKYRFNGASEFESDFELNIYNTPLRTYDPQIGRFRGHDIAAAQNHAFSPFSYGQNNPAYYNDPTGAISMAQVQALIDVLWASGGGGYWQAGMDVPFFYSSVANSGGTLISSPVYDNGRNYSFIVGGYFGEDGNIVTKSNESGFAISGTFQRVDISKAAFDADVALNGYGKEEKSPFETAIPAAIAAASADGPSLIGDAIGVGILAAAAVQDATQRVYVTYTLKNPVTGQIYAGRSSGFGDPYAIMMRRFAGHEMRKVYGYGSPQLDVFVKGRQNYPAIRGREQDIVDAYGGIGSPLLGNRINPISPYNLNRSFYMMQSYLKFGKYVKNR